MSRLGSAGLQEIITNLTKGREAQLSKIEGLFDQFGVAARQDIETGFKKRRGSEEQGLISRGLSQTTRRATKLEDLATQRQRELGRVDEQVAGQKAGFLERQLVDPALLTSLITGASAVDTTPTRVQVGAAGAVSQPAPSFGQRATNTIGASPQPSNFGSTAAGGFGATSARIVTGSGSFTPAEFLAQRDRPQTASVATNTQAAVPQSQAPGTGPAAPPVRATGGSGSIVDSATKKTLATTGQGPGDPEYLELKAQKAKNSFLIFSKNFNLKLSAARKRHIAAGGTP